MAGEKKIGHSRIMESSVKEKQKKKKKPPVLSEGKQGSSEKNLPSARKVGPLGGEGEPETGRRWCYWDVSFLTAVGVGGSGLKD